MVVKKVKTAVIGAGMISDIYLENLKKRFSIIELVGISDMVSEKSKKQSQKYNIKQMTNEEILDDDGELIILKVCEEDGETYLEPIEDDNEFNEIGKIFEERLSELFEKDKYKRVY